MPVVVFPPIHFTRGGGKAAVCAPHSNILVGYCPPTGEGEGEEGVVRGSERRGLIVTRG